MVRPVPSADIKTGTRGLRRRTIQLKVDEGWSLVEARCAPRAFVLGLEFVPGLFLRVEIILGRVVHDDQERGGGGWRFLWFSIGWSYGRI